MASEILQLGTKSIEHNKQINWKLTASDGYQKC
jgi:hypothetical protein